MKILKDVLLCIGVVVALGISWANANFIFEERREIYDSQFEMRRAIEYYRNKYKTIQDVTDGLQAVQDTSNLNLSQEIQSLTAQVHDLNDHRIDEEYLAALDEKIGKLMTNQAELRAVVARIRASKQCCCPYGAKR